MLQRSVKRVHCTPTDRVLLVLLASRVRTWRHALLIVQPQTLLCWHRQECRLFWRRRSRASASMARPTVAAETIALIKEMAAANRLWGAERIRGELLKLNMRVAKTTVQRTVHAAGTAAAALRPDLGDLPAYARQGHLGLRLPAGD